MRAGGYLSLFLCLLLCFSCKKTFEAYKPFQIPGAGLEVDQGQLHWSINVGIMTDAGFPQPDRKQVTLDLEEAARRLAAQLPGFQLHTIVDQPMDAVFLLEQSVPGSALGRRYEAQYGVLLVDDATHNQTIWQAQQAAADQRTQLQAGLASYRQTLLDRGYKPSADRITGSLYIWQAYYEHQVRNDLILTNTPLLEDRSALYLRDSNAAGLSNKPGGLAADQRLHIARQANQLTQIALLPAPGRTAMERVGAVVSLYQQEPDPEKRVQVLERSLLSLVMANSACLHCTGTGAGECACLQTWPQRKEYLQGLALVRSSELEQACRLMQKKHDFRWQKTPARWETRLCKSHQPVSGLYFSRDQNFDGSRINSGKSCSHARG